MKVGRSRRKNGSTRDYRSDFNPSNLFITIWFKQVFVSLRQRRKQQHQRGSSNERTNGNSGTHIAMTKGPPLLTIGFPSWIVLALFVVWRSILSDCRGDHGHPLDTSTTHDFHPFFKILPPFVDLGKDARMMMMERRLVHLDDFSSETFSYSIHSKDEGSFFYWRFGLIYLSQLKKGLAEYPYLKSPFKYLLSLFFQCLLSTHL